MKKCFLLLATVLGATYVLAQGNSGFTLSKPQFYEIKTIRTTPVKNQAKTGTCWSFSTTSLVESDGIRKEIGEIDLSEMFAVRNIYLEKAKNYILRQGRAQFSEGGLSHDMIRATAAYGTMPESAFTGLVSGQKEYNHQKLAGELKAYLDTLLTRQPVAGNWLEGYTTILDKHMGTPPAQFTYQGKTYTPQRFASEVLKFNAADYVSLTSFTHQPFYQSFILQVPDNFANGSFYNLPLNELVQVVKEAVNNGYSVAWDADVSNQGFRQELGFALNLDPAVKYSKEMLSVDMKELPYDALTRQQLYENLTTQDDHLMHIVGVEKSKDGKTFFVVKNSWGRIGPFAGYIHVSEAYFAINTISLVVPKAALSKELTTKLGLK